MELKDGGLHIIYVEGKSREELRDFKININV